MTVGTKIRALAKLIDASEAIVWALDPAGRLIYLSGGAVNWLLGPSDSDASTGHSPTAFAGEDLIGRTCRTGVAISKDPLDTMAATLSAPPDLAARGTSRLRVRPPSRRDATDVRFVSISDVGTIAVAGEFHDRVPDEELADVVRIRAILDEHRRFQSRRSHAITAGVSAQSALLRRRMTTAAQSHANVLFVGPAGCGSQVLANELVAHHETHWTVANPSHHPATVVVDGGIMDAELVEAALMPTLGWLERSADNQAAVLVESLDQMPPDAQAMLRTIHDRFSSRLRIIGSVYLAKGSLLPHQSATGSVLELLPGQNEITGLLPSTQTLVGEFVIPLLPLSQRVEDIPMIATAMLDHRQSVRTGDPIILSRDALDALVIYPWPGEIDELDAAIRQGSSLTPSNRVAVEHLPLAVRSYRPEAISGQVPIPSLDDSVRRHEANLIRRALNQCEGNRTEAAKRLDISRGRLLRKIDELKAEGWMEDE